MIQLIKAATLGTSKQERIIAEQKIMQLRLQNTETFFGESCAILQNDQLPSNLRQASGTIIDMSILTQTPQGYLWDKLQPIAKQNIKDSVLGVLIDPDRNIRRGAANIVAAICCIEIPRNEWEGIVEKISQNIRNQDLLIKQVSILTLGFICERLKDKKSFVFSLSLQQTVLSGILLGLKQNQRQIVETALKALRDGVSSMSDILNNPQYRDYLVNQIVEIIRNNDYKNYGLQIIIQFAKGSYNHLEHYFTGFITLLEPILINTKDQDNCIQAMEFFESVATEYKSRLDDDPHTKNYITGINGQKIVTLLLENLCSVEQEQDNEENGLVDSASKCLESIFEEDSQEYEKIVLAFASNTIKHQSWKYRQASIRAFAIFLIGVEQKRKQELVDSSLLSLIALLNDSSNSVQYSAIRSINIISEESAESFLHHPNFLDILKLIVSKISISQGFLKNVCKIIDNLCAVCQQTQQPYFHDIADNLIQVLFDTSFTTTSSLHVINCCILTIMNLITVSFNNQVSLKYIAFVTNHFGDIRKLDAEKRDLLYSSFFTLIQTCLISLRKEKVDMEILSNIYTLVINHYSSFNKVDSDGLYVVGTLSNFFRDQTRLIDDFWKYIEYALTLFTQTHVFKAALSCVCDFASNYGPAMGAKIPQLMINLLEAFQKTQVSRQSKLDLIMCIGELYLNCGQLCLPYLNETINLLFVACQASLAMKDTDLNYAELLRENIIDTFTCMLHGLCEDERPNPAFLGSVENIFEFIRVTCDKNIHPKVNYVKSCVLWMADATKFYKTNVQKYVRQPWAWECLQVLKKHNKNNNMDQVLDYAKKHF